MKLCNIPNCGRQLLAKGLCSSHYRHVYVEGRSPKPIKDQQLPLIDRFWGKVDTTGPCWVWQAATSDQGYGVLGNGNKGTVYAHRFSWELAQGPIPDGLEVCHTCDNRVCVRPGHLFLGTHQQNMEDMAVKLRSGVATLTPDQVLEIAKLRRAGVPRKEIVAQTGVNVHTLKCILSGRNWGHLTGF